MTQMSPSSSRQEKYGENILRENLSRLFLADLQPGKLARLPSSNDSFQWP